MSSASDTGQTGKIRLTTGHRDVIKATDVFLGGICMFNLATALASWLSGAATIRAPLVVFAFLAINLIISQISLKAKNPYLVERLRTTLGGVLVPACYVLMDGPLFPWWPAAVINTLGGTVLLGLLSQKPYWGRGVAIYYATAITIATLLFIPHPNYWALALQVGVIIVVGFMFAEILSLLGVSLHNEHERRMELASARDALFAEMEVAQSIQTLLLPSPAELPDLDVAGRMLPATEVGGDYYDVIPTAHRGTLLAIGDVAGHGVSAGLTMMMARSSLLGALEASPKAPLSDLYLALNRSLCSNLKRMKQRLYMTFALLEHRGDGHFAAVGRHLPIAIYRRASDTVEEIELGGAWLGLIDSLEPEHVPELTFRLEEGDLLCLYTDGIVEHEGNDGTMFGFERLAQLLRRHADRDVREVVGSLVDALDVHKAQQEDDVTLLLIRHGGSERRSSEVRLNQEAART